MWVKLDFRYHPNRKLKRLTSTRLWAVGKDKFCYYIVLPKQDYQIANDFGFNFFQRDQITGKKWYQLPADTLTCQISIDRFYSICEGCNGQC
jgi:hypothetical protein